MQVVTVDSGDFRKEVASMKAEGVLYRNWDGLNTNVLMPAFKSLKERLDKILPNESNKSLKEELAVPLFEILEQWAYRSKEEDSYGIHEAHAAMLAAGNTEEAKIAFIKKCS